MFATDGPDTSHYQTVTHLSLVPDWELWSHKATEGRSFKDPSLATFLGYMAAKNVRYRGIYHWLRPDHDLGQQLANLKSVVAALGGLPKGMMIQIDWERTSGTTAGDNGCATQAQAQQFWNMCQHEWPNRVIMYSANWVPGFVGWRNANPEAPVWYANYTSQAVNMAKKYDSTLIQWTSTYNASGFVGKIDMNMILKRNVLDQLCGYGDTPVVVNEPPPVVIEPNPAPTTPGQAVPDTGDEMQVIADSDTMGSALVTFTRNADNVAGHTMAGYNTEDERNIAIEAGMKVVHWPDAFYAARAASAFK